MPFTVTARHTANSFISPGTSSVNLATNSTTPTANSLLLVCANAINDTHTTAQDWQLPSGGGLTYTLVGEAADVPWDGNAQFTQSAAMHRATVGASPSAHTILVDCYSAGGSAFYGAACVDITGYGSVTPVQSKVNSSTVTPFSDSASATITLDAVPTAGNLIVVAFGSGADNGGGFTTPTAGGGKTFTSGNSANTNGIQIEVFYRVADGTESATITCSDVGQQVGNWTVTAAEILGSGPSSGPVAVPTFFRSTQAGQLWR